MQARTPLCTFQGAVHHVVPAACFVPARSSTRGSVFPATTIRQKRIPLRSLTVQARHDPDRAADVLHSLKSSCSKFVNRYDPVAVGTGVIMVTGYMVVVHHQAVDEALNISAFATTLGMVHGMNGSWPIGLQAHTVLKETAREQSNATAAAAAAADGAGSAALFALKQLLNRAHLLHRILQALPSWRVLA